MMESEPRKPAGLRARKRQATREKIAEMGLKMFLANGFEATTLDAIAEAAGISRRTFFHYFDSKEAVLQAWVGALEAAFRAAVRAQPAALPPLDVVRNALAAVIAIYETQEAIAIDRLMRSTDALRARKQAHYQQHEQAMFETLVERWPDPAQRDSLRFVAMLGVGVLRLASEAWSAKTAAKTLADYVNEGFEALRAQMSA